MIKAFELSVFYSTNWWVADAVTCIFVFAILTDWLDGFLARKVCLQL
jgi:phosphatidylglycerophosphate synthase